VSEEYHARTFVPALVREAEALAESLGFTLSCRPEVGRLLHTLVATVRAGRVGEMGTGCGYGAAWMASALGPDSTLVTVEHDAERAEAAARLFAARPNVRVIHADATALLNHGPFDLVFVDGGGGVKGSPSGDDALRGRDVLAPLLAAVRPGGVIVLDDLTPEASWPPEWRGQPDPTRALWLNDPRLAAVELIVDPAAGRSSAVIVATHLGRDARG
jgi:predicted O-methyltransferase YrrM